jgi:hypothetical protein
MKINLYKQVFDYLCHYYGLDYTRIIGNHVILGLQTNGFKVTDKVCSVSALKRIDGVLEEHYTDYVQPRIGEDDDEKDIYERIAKLETDLAGHIDFTLTVDKVRNGLPSRTVGRKVEQLLQFAIDHKMPIVSFSMFNFGWARLNKHILPSSWSTVDTCPNLIDLGMIEKAINTAYANDTELDFPDNAPDWYAQVASSSIKVKWALHPTCTSNHFLIQDGETKFEHKYVLYQRLFDSMYAQSMK